jgi:hypothetical protein
MERHSAQALGDSPGEGGDEVSVAAFIACQRAEYAAARGHVGASSPRWRRTHVVQISNWITEFYDARRRHSACGGMSPIGYKAIHDRGPRLHRFY